MIVHLRTYGRCARETRYRACMLLYNVTRTVSTDVSLIVPQAAVTATGFCKKCHRLLYTVDHCHIECPHCTHWGIAMPKSQLLVNELNKVQHTRYYTIRKVYNALPRLIYACCSLSQRRDPRATRILTIALLCSMREL